MVSLLQMHLLLLGTFGIILLRILVSKILVSSAISTAKELLFVKSVKCAGKMQRASPVWVKP